MNKETIEQAVSIRIGDNWKHGIIPGSVKVSNGWVKFTCAWGRNNKTRNFVILIDEITGIETE